MADVLTKTNLFSSHNHNVSVFPKSCVFDKFGNSLKLKSSEVSSISLSSNGNFLGRRIVLQEDKPLLPNGGSSRSNAFLVNAQTSLRIGKAQKWWEKGLEPNMREITSVQDYVDSLLNAGDKLVVVDFFSPGCGGCKALHPKVCQLAEMNPDVQLLQVNYEEHKSMSYSLNVHVLPFFRFYRGAHGRLCSFSCTNATIKKFKDALAKHTPDRCSIGPTKGLGEKELLALSGNRDLSFSYTPKPIEPVPFFAEQVVVEEAEISFTKKEAVPAASLNLAQSSDKKTLVTVGR